MLSARKFHTWPNPTHKKQAPTRVACPSNTYMLRFEYFDFFHLVAAFKSIDMLHAFNDLAEYGMLSVQVRLRLIAYIELASARVASGMRHSQASTLMLVRVDLAIDRVARSACTCSVRAAALSDEARNDAVEY